MNYQLSEMTMVELNAQLLSRKGDLHSQFIFTNEWQDLKNKLNEKTT